MQLVTNDASQYVGHVEGDTYYTQRSEEKGQIFTRKEWFGDQHMKIPVGLSVVIAQRLKRQKVKYVNYHLLMGNIGKNVIVPLWYIIQNGERVKYGKKWGEQFIIDAGLFENIYQPTLQEVTND